MTFQAAGVWFAVHVADLDRVVGASEERSRRLWPVPMTCQGYAGLFDDGQELVPVLDLVATKDPCVDCQLAVVRVNGTALGLRVECTGRVIDEYEVDVAVNPPTLNRTLPGRSLSSAGEKFWLLDLPELHASIENNLLNRIH